MTAVYACWVEAIAESNSSLSSSVIIKPLEPCLAALFFKTLSRSLEVGSALSSLAFAAREEKQNI